MSQKNSKPKEIYLDYHATTPCDPIVANAVRRTARNYYGNPSSPHQAGRSAKKKLESARAAIAEHIGAHNGEVVFTSGATESNNLAMRGLLRGMADREIESYSHIAVSSIEHKSVSKTAEYVGKKYGLKVKRLPVGTNGLVDIGAAQDIITDGTLLVSVQAVNNEIGTIQPVKEIANFAKKAGAWMHCDAAQALGRCNIDVKELAVDLMSLSSHKVYGPKGIGVLYIDGGPSSHPIAQLRYGGGQESGLRPGTVNVPGSVGFGVACQILNESLDEELSRFASLRDELEERIQNQVEGEIRINGDTSRVETTSNIHFPGVEAEALIGRTPSLAISTGSACESGAPEPSHVLTAIGLNREEAYQCVRLAVGRFTSREDIVKASEIIAENVNMIRRIEQPTSSQSTG